ncbi:hypothetical protein [Streptomyces sp. CBMA156]|uniref:hypothetical protein n=1 Tax=Streptomyces sp. CBMA156 TaxID=1930280 RepID=UPI001661D3DA|nr:hypothetical protein [Streptomyces sp. CBMA156]MBD0673550.1 hypothetical protein [Streptomyces sp. CBMA156]
MARSRQFGPPVPVPAPWVLRLLLLAALLLGIVTMHTLGHPGGGHGGHEGSGTGVSAMPPAGAAHHGPDAGAPSVHPAAHPAAFAVDPTGVGPAAPGGLDPMAVCLAVLAGWTLVLLVVGPLLRRSGDAAAEVRARLLTAVRALPPPGGGRILLTRLSVLRQ